MQTEYTHILQKLELLKPTEYAKNRNFIDGDVSKLSPYISRGVISTKQVFDYVMSLDYPFYKIEKFVQELAWRDYWQQIWINKGTLINYKGNRLICFTASLPHQAMPVSRLCHDLRTCIVFKTTKVNE